MYTKDTQQGKDTAKNISADIHEDLRLIKEKARETRDAITQAATDVRDHASVVLNRSLKDVRDRTTDLQDNVVTYVKGNPVKAIGIAALAGLILAQLLRK